MRVSFQFSSDVSMRQHAVEGARVPAISQTSWRIFKKATGGIRCRLPLERAAKMLRCVLTLTLQSDIYLVTWASNLWKRARGLQGQLGC